MLARLGIWLSGGSCVSYEDGPASTPAEKTKAWGGGRKERKTEGRERRREERGATFR